MQRWDEGWCFSLLFLLNGMQIAICLSWQLWMCTTKQGVFEHTVTVLIMRWSHTEKGTDWVQKKWHRDFFAVHLPALDAVTFPRCDASVPSARKFSCPQKNYAHRYTLLLTFTYVCKGEQNGADTFILCTANSMLLSLPTLPLYTYTHTRAHTHTHICSSWPFACQPMGGLRIFICHSNVFRGKMPTRREPRNSGQDLSLSLFPFAHTCLCAWQRLQYHKFMVIEMAECLEGNAVNLILQKRRSVYSICTQCHTQHDRKHLKVNDLIKASQASPLTQCIKAICWLLNKRIIFYLDFCVQEQGPCRSQLLLVGGCHCCVYSSYPCHDFVSKLSSWFGIFFLPTYQLWTAMFSTHALAKVKSGVMTKPLHIVLRTTLPMFAHWRNKNRLNESWIEVTAI